MPSLPRLFFLLAVVVLSGMGWPYLPVHAVVYQASVSFSTASAPDDYSPFDLFNLSLEANASEGSTFFIEEFTKTFLAPQDALNNYYSIINEGQPFYMLTGGSIQVTLDYSSATAAMNTIFSSDAFMVYASRFLLDPSEGNVGGNGSDSDSNASLEGMSPSPQSLFFFYNQPRLHCIYNAPLFTENQIYSRPTTSEKTNAKETNNKSRAGLCTSVESMDLEDTSLDVCANRLLLERNDLFDPPNLRRLISVEYLLAQSDVQLKIFEKDVLYRLLNVEQDKVKQEKKKGGKDQNEEELYDQLEVIRILNYDLQLYPSRICTAPALYTLSLNKMIQGFYDQSMNPATASSIANNTVTLDHSYAPVSLVAVVVQCSEIPIDLNLLVELRNAGNNGSGEYYMASIIYFVFMVLYFALFVIFLVMIIPCGRNRHRKNAESTDTPTVLKKKNQSKKSASHSDLSDPSLLENGNNNNNDNNNNNNSNNNKEGSSSRGGGGSVHRKGGEGNVIPTLNPSSNSSSLYSLNSTDNDDSSSSSSSSSEGDGNNSCCSRLTTFIRNHYGFRHTLVFYPPLQWITFVVIIAKVLYCIFVASNYSILTGINFINDTTSGLEILSLILYVFANSLIFATEVLVGLGWGVAYDQLGTGSIIILSLSTLVAFVLYILVATCRASATSQTALVFNSNRYARQRAGTSCMAFSYVSAAYDIVFHIHNGVQLIVVTSTLAKTILPKSSFRELSKSFMLHQAIRHRVHSLVHSYRESDAAENGVEGSSTPFNSNNTNTTTLYTNSMAGGRHHRGGSKLRVRGNHMGGTTAGNGGLESINYMQYYSYLHYIKSHYKQNRNAKNSLMRRTDWRTQWHIETKEERKVSSLKRDKNKRKKKRSSGKKKKRTNKHSSQKKKNNRPRHNITRATSREHREVTPTDEDRPSLRGVDEDRSSFHSYDDDDDENSVFPHTASNTRVNSPPPPPLSRTRHRPRGTQSRRKRTPRKQETLSEFEDVVSSASSSSSASDISSLSSLTNSSTDSLFMDGGVFPSSKYYEENSDYYSHARRRYRARGARRKRRNGRRGGVGDDDEDAAASLYETEGKYNERVGRRKIEKLYELEQRVEQEQIFIFQLFLRYSSMRVSLFDDNCMANHFYRMCFFFSECRRLLCRDMFYRVYAFLLSRIRNAFYAKDPILYLK